MVQDADEEILIKRIKMIDKIEMMYRLELEELHTIFFNYKQLQKIKVFIDNNEILNSLSEDIDDKLQQIQDELDKKWNRVRDIKITLDKMVNENEK